MGATGNDDAVAPPDGEMASEGRVETGYESDASTLASEGESGGPGGAPASEGEQVQGQGHSEDGDDALTLVSDSSWAPQLAAPSPTLSFYSDRPLSSHGDGDSATFDNIGAVGEGSDELNRDPDHRDWAWELVTAVYGPIYTWSIAGLLDAGHEQEQRSPRSLARWGRTRSAVLGQGESDLLDSRAGR